MAKLTGRDAERFLRFLAAADGLAGDQPFAPRFLEELGGLVHADRVTYVEQDQVRQRTPLMVNRTGEAWTEEPTASFWDIADEHPVCRRRHDTGNTSALKLSDFVGLRQLRHSRVYAEWFRPLGRPHELSVYLVPAPPSYSKMVIFGRAPGRDFTERDRLLLDLLQPHFGRLWRAAHVRRRLRAALTALEGEDEHQAQGVIVLAPGGRIEVVSPAARRLIREYFHMPCQTELPPELREWLESGARTNERQRNGRRLRIERSDGALLLEETRPELGLTARESEILTWVARGKTNREIAELLWIAPTTVRKHLENVYAKLGVRTRTAAVARSLDVLDHEEREQRAL